ncbi:MAG: PLP-dependent transferase, partial [Pseudomonadota bacterium]|nr:PLP-dependent transferase [Pseudomonadota bacterium]
KHIDGQGRCLGGIILGNEAYVRDELANFMRQTGPALAPFNAWVMLKSLETLPVRVDAHCDNAEKLVDFLNTHDKVGRVIYPSDKNHPQHDLACRQMTRGGNLIAFDVGADKADAFRFANNLNIAAISNNLGDAKTLITHPATTTHFRLDDAAKAELGIRPTSLRVSIGLEDPADLVEDFERALDAI